MKHEIWLEYIIHTANIIAPFFLLLFFLFFLFTINSFIISVLTKSVSFKVMLLSSLISCALGVFVGFFSGNSRNPVIGDIIPAILTLLISILGYIFTKEKLADHSRTMWVKALPIAILVLLMSTPPSIVLGAKMRDDGEVTKAIREAKIEQVRKLYIEVCANTVTKYLEEKIKDKEKINNIDFHAIYSVSGCILPES